MFYDLKIPRSRHYFNGLLWQAVLTSLFILALIGNARGQAEARSPASETPAETDLVHHGDLIDVDVIGSLEYDWRGSLSPEGFLEGPESITEPVYGLCKSETEIASELITAFAKFLRDPKVVVKVVDRSRRAEAIVAGAVRTPYRFRIRRPIRLNELIILTGGITDRSSGEISVFRPESLSCAGTISSTLPGRKEAFVKTSQSDGFHTTIIKIRDLLAGNLEANPLILSGDIVTVSEAVPVYVIGGVNNPRQLSLRSQITLSRAIASSGGLAKDALEDKITIYRRVNGQTQMISADLSRIRSKQAEDISLSPNDIIDVGQKGREKRRFPPRVDDASRLSGAPLGLRIIE